MLDKLPIEITKRISECLDSAQSKIDIVKTRNDFN